MPRRVPFREAFRFWLKLGFISFGGPAGQIATMDRELVERRRWISEKRFLHALNYCMALPGPEAQQLATYIGFLLHGTVGGIVAGSLFILPSVFVLWFLSWAYMAYGHVPAVDGVLAGFKPAVIAVILAASWRVGRRAIKTRVHGAIAVSALVALQLGVAFPWVVAGAALAGFLAHRFGLGRAPAARADPASREASDAAPRSIRYVIDDETPTPGHALPSRARTLRQLACALLLWGGVEGTLVLATGSTSTLTEMGLFFTLAALVTFGGAYAVLPFIAQFAIESHGWLRPDQMVDGLALGETTPGPLIMVVAFVGYVGAWQAVGPSHGWAGLLVATWFTFLPSFFFILVGAPHIERIRGRLGWTAPLAAVSAAVVGVILSLAVYLAPPVLFPGRTPSWFALGLFAACALALFWRRWTVHWVVLAAGAVGLARGLLFG